MRHLLAGIFALTAAASLAHADASAGPSWPKLYASYRPSFTGDEKLARDTVEGIVKSCRTSQMSRIGPSEAEIARCQRAETRVLALGTDGAQAAFALLDEERLGYSAAMDHLYVVIARAGDPRTIAPLVGALDRIATGGETMTNRQYEATMIAETLRALTFAGIGIQERWGDQTGDAPKWRAWLEAHRGMSRAQLLAARTVEARREKDAGDAWVAFGAAEFLSSRQATRAEGLASLKALSQRSGLDEAMRQEVQIATTNPVMQDRIITDDRRV